jgi:hypothetical protein
MPDIARMSRNQLSDAARSACLDQVMRALQRSALLGIPASLLLVLILGNSVPLDRRIVFVVTISIADIITMFYAVRYMSRRRRGEMVRTYTPGLVCTVLVSLAWATPALYALPGSRDVELRSVYLLFVLASSATYVVGTAARRRYFLASQITMLVPVTIAFLASADRVSRLLGLAVPI